MLGDKSVPAFPAAEQQFFSIQVEGYTLSFGEIGFTIRILNHDVLDGGNRGAAVVKTPGPGPDFPI
jgi:hypothetical protein